MHINFAENVVLLQKKKNEDIKFGASTNLVNENDIKIETEGNELRISANSSVRKYTKTVKLPFNIKKKLKQRYKNGILELVFRK